MDKELIQQGKLDNSGNLIISSRENAGGVIRKIQYGIIKIMGDSKEYRVSYRTLFDIANKPPQFKGNIIIPELRLKIPLSSIVFQQFREEKQFISSEYSELPTVELICERIGDEFKISNKTEAYYKKSGVKYWLVVAHILDRQTPDLKFNNVKQALLMQSKEENYPSTILEIYRYGKKQENL